MRKCIINAAKDLLADLDDFEIIISKQGDKQLQGRLRWNYACALSQ